VLYKEDDDTSDEALDDMSFGVSNADQYKLKVLEEALEIE
jgi:hypothetical protein